MKLLMFQAHQFWCKPSVKSVPHAEDETREVIDVKDAIAAFVHFEEKDENDSKIVTKLIKNIKWLAGKAGFKNIVMHSFAHLSSSTLDFDKALELFNQAIKRLENAGYNVTFTPYGYFCELKLHVRGNSLGRVFKEF